MGTPFEFFEVGVSLVAQILVDADLRSVVAINCQVLDSPEESLEVRPGLQLVLADLLEQRRLLLPSRIAETRGAVSLTFLVDGLDSFSPESLAFFGRLTHHQIDEGGDAAFLCTRR